MWTVEQAETFKALLEESEPDFTTTFDNMKRYGGSFVQSLRELYFAADESNKLRALRAFGEYFDHYRRMEVKQ